MHLVFHVKQPHRNKSSNSELIEEVKAELSALRELTIQHGLTFDDQQYERMLAFLHLLLEWNRAFNLVSRADEPRIVTRHVAESIGILLLAEMRDATAVLDIGSGGGFPAVPMNILRPDVFFTLVESNGKKASFLKNVGMKLSLQNYLVYQKRIESLRPGELRQQSQVTARAVADLSVLWGWAVEYLAPGGVLLSIKGGEASKEVDSVSRLETVGGVSITAFPGWLNIDKSRFVISVKKKREFES